MLSGLRRFVLACIFVGAAALMARTVSDRNVVPTWAYELPLGVAFVVSILLAVRDPRFLPKGLSFADARTLSGGVRWLLFVNAALLFFVSYFGDGAWIDDMYLPASIAVTIVVILLVHWWADVPGVLSAAESDGAADSSEPSTEGNSLEYHADLPERFDDVQS